MHSLRASIRSHRHVAMLLIALALLLKAVIPAGFMLSRSADTVLTVTICSNAADMPRQMRIVVPGKDSHGSTTEAASKDTQCHFSGLGHAALGGADAVLLALAFAVILVLGMAPARRLPFGRVPYLRPPLRGPPAAA